MSKPSVLLLYGIDEQSQRFEIDSTLHLVYEAAVALGELGWRVVPLQITHDLVTPLQRFDPRDWVVLNICEGTPQQDFYYAKVTSVLGELGYTFTGSDSWSLNETQYKWRMKELLEVAGVPTPRWALCDNPDTLQFDAFPAIVKPAAEHCSYGITRDSVVLNLAEARRQAARIIAEFNQPALLEEFLDSDEFNVSVWGSVEHPAGFEVLGISTMQYGYFQDIHDRLCTFDAKWSPDSEAYRQIPALCPALISRELQDKIERVAIAAYRASYCRDYGRVDMRLRNGEPMVLDVNSNCDVSSDGGFMNAARAKGMSYGGMLQRLIELAIARGPNNRPGDGQYDGLTMPQARQRVFAEVAR
jgi:D-alanine-D-alanine ligase